MSTNEIPSVDFSDFSEAGEKKKKKSKLNASGVRWWLADEALLPGAVMSQVSAIINADRGRIEGYNTFAKLYGTWTPTMWNGYQLASSGRPTAPMRDRLTYNIVQSCIDTLTARISQNKPKPMFLTSGGDSKLQRKAKKLDSFAYGLFYENNLYKKGPKGLRDGFVFGEGIIHPYSEAGRVKFERVFPYEILMDYLEGHYGEESVKSMFRIKNIDRSELLELYPDQADSILKMTGTSIYLQAASKSVSDTVTVVEAWRLPVGSKQGRHVIVTDNSILHDEDYEDEFFPFAIYRFSDRLYGPYAQGMAEQLVPAQIEINRTLISIQRSLYLGGTHKIFVKAGSKVIKSHFDNMIGTILEWSGDTPPAYVTPQLVQAEIYSHLESMKQSAYQLVGVSQLSASNLKPQGVDSGRALRAVDDVQVQRQQPVAQGYEQFYMDMSRIAISVARRTYEKHGKFSVKVPGKRFIEEINWKDVDLDNDEFSLQVYPVSKLPNDPEGRLATIQEMMQSGLVSPEVGRRLLDYPDLDGEEALANSSLDYLNKILDDMVEGGEFTAPEPFDDLVQARKLALEFYARAKFNKIAEDRLEMLRRFIKQIDTLTQPAPPPVPGMPQVGGAGAVPQAQPTAPPTSNLIPNVAGPVAS
jgi:hypothetical protein